MWTVKLKLVLLGTTWQWPTGTLISVVGRRMIILGTTGWRRSTERALGCFTPSFSHVWLNLFGFVVLVLFLVSNCLIPFSSHKSCGVFQVSEGHWTYSWTYVLVLRVSLRLFNLDCRYPRDLLQPERKKKGLCVFLCFFFFCA